MVRSARARIGGFPMKNALVILALLAVGACVPHASAGCDPTGLACATESSYSEGDCAAGDGFESRSTTVNVAGAATVTGAADCSRGGGFGSSSNSVAANVGPASVLWSSFSYDDPENGHFDGCFLYVGPLYESCPAALGPPDPGWGHLLP
jgi:hypothetical protein